MPPPTMTPPTIPAGLDPPATTSPPATSLPADSPLAGCARPDGWASDGGGARLVSCYDCGAVVPVAEALTTVDHTTFCRDCQPRVWRCADCGGFSEDSDDDCGSSYCRRCCGCDSCTADCDGDGAEDLFEAEYLPRLVFHGDGPLFLGLELEVEARKGRRWQAIAIAGRHLGSLGWLKQERSLHHGFEIVTHPMSYPFAVDHFPWHLLTDLDTADASTHEGTGLHIHLSRAGFTGPAHIYRWMKLIHRNRAQVTVLARRDNHSSAPFTDHDRAQVRDYAKGGYGTRFCAINPTNDDTFELRMFASSLDIDQVQAALGFAAATVAYTRDLTPAAIHTGGWTWAAFVAWLSHHDDYGPLLRELHTRRCLT